MSDITEIDVRSEIGTLEAVIIHPPGNEVQNMVPDNVERALYSDILNLDVASKEYSQFSAVLAKVAKTFNLLDLLTDILTNAKVKKRLITNICAYEKQEVLTDYLLSLEPADLSRELVEGVLMKKNTLTKFISHDRYILQPLHNFFYMRDASVSILDDVLISKMANPVRERESMIMEAIFDYHPQLKTKTVNPIVNGRRDPDITIEGGDILVVRDDILCIGVGGRTTTQGIDFIIRKLRVQEGRRHIVIQELPKTPESFIHLDMVFTLIDKDTCMLYEPLIMRSHKHRTIHVIIDNGKVELIEERRNIIETLKHLGMDLKPMICGGSKDSYAQEREQWHSGANFLAVGPGKIIGYARNVYTIEEMHNNGFQVIPSEDVISGKTNLDDYAKYVVTIAGNELSRGGGGARCMTMPIRRKAVDW